LHANSRVYSQDVATHSPIVSSARCSYHKVHGVATFVQRSHCSNAF